MDDIDMAAELAKTNKRLDEIIERINRVESKTDRNHHGIRVAQEWLKIWPRDDRDL